MGRANRNANRNAGDPFAGVLGAARGGGLKAAKPDTLLIPSQVTQRFAELREIVRFNSASYDPPALNHDSKWALTGSSDHDDSHHLLGTTADEFGFDAICDAAVRDEFTPLWAVKLDAPNDACVWTIYHENDGSYSWDTSMAGKPLDYIEELY